MEHRIADHRVVDPGPVGQDHAGHLVAPGHVVGHGAPGLVEDIRGVRPDRENSQSFGHDLVSLVVCIRIPA